MGIPRLGPGILGTAHRRRMLSRRRVLGLAAVLLAVTAAVSARAADQVESRVVLGSHYVGADLGGGRSAWPRGGVLRAGVNQPTPYVDGGIAPVPVTPPGTTPAAQLHEMQIAQSPRPDRPGSSGILSEVRAGILAHDIGVFGSSKEDGIDLNLDVYFVSPRLLDVIWSPRPHLGTAVNSAGDTSHIYGGLAWDWTFWEPFFVEGTLALAVHDGKLDEGKLDRKALGCRALFRESASLGARLLERHSISLQFAHISNANLCDHNGGLDTFGIQYGYRF